VDTSEPNAETISRRALPKFRRIFLAKLLVVKLLIPDVKILSRLFGCFAGTEINVYTKVAKGAKVAPGFDDNTDVEFLTTDGH